ncbi:topoisomerase C-terminal repeat-containing protein (plasmid) [Metabacillus halosaccharovorans]|uniref:topoisomerase C-terminal repeat-containing protein n=1 Tax=Metabacillus halosaccharovorans TaxID=930124 RepID=UPI001C200E3E|nr:topoisomerase C-terminal repeat-containing protein [Metabacillus halosaccharovorans]MBU7595859.1 hypothetical protein [Metabacillus halosaccharovorans]
MFEKVLEESHSWDFLPLLSNNKEKIAIGHCKLCSGIVIDKGKFYGCDQYLITNCSLSIPKKIAGRDISSVQIKKILETGTSSLIRGFKKSQKNDTFDAFLTWDNIEEKVKFSFEGYDRKLNSKK